MKYAELRATACKELLKIQDRFKQKYQIDSYSNWFYNQSTGFLHFYNENDTQEIYFKYIAIGTYSIKTKTWMWNWENEHSLEKSKQQLLELKKIGEENNYEKLSNGYFDSDEYDGWDFIAIALKFFGGLGGYRVQTDHLLKYMLISEVVPTLKAKAVEEKLIQCNEHGLSRSAYVCQHLNMQEKMGFEEAFSTFRGMDLDEEDSLQAWCNTCEKIRREHNGWNDKAMALTSIKLVCEVCYFNLKDFNLENSK